MAQNGQLKWRHSLEQSKADLYYYRNKNMNLGTATELLGNNGRYFSQLYKHFQFTDTQTLKEYIDFIQHEPVEWMKAFKGTNKNTFALPKTAVVKLLRNPTVVAELGGEYCNKAYECVWNTFKTNVDAFLAKRNSAVAVAVAPVPAVAPTLVSTSTIELVTEFDNLIENISVNGTEASDTSRHSVKPIKNIIQYPAGLNSVVTTPWEKKYRILENAYRELSKNISNESTRASMLLLLDALSS